MEIIDIDTTQAPPAITIIDDKQLCDVVYDLASKQLLINEAEAAQQAKIEAAKKAFADATEPLASDIKTLFAAVEAYATTNKNRLFPLKGKTRSKTFKVLAHKLQYRSSEQVQAPANAVTVIKTLMESLDLTESDELRTEEETARLDQTYYGLRDLIRQPEPELNKDAVKACSDKVVKDYLAAHGITVETLETFKLAFAFTPEQTAN